MSPLSCQHCCPKPQTTSKITTSDISNSFPTKLPWFGSFPSMFSSPLQALSNLWLERDRSYKLLHSNGAQPLEQSTDARLANQFQELRCGGKMVELVDGYFMGKCYFLVSKKGDYLCVGCVQCRQEDMQHYWTD